jgi:predicted HicB family RNase H-like nuclease
MAPKAINLRTIPEELHRQVKMSAAKEEVTMVEWVMDAIMQKLVVKAKEAHEDGQDTHS